MQIDRRFADYALTGGFFLICQLPILWILDYRPNIGDVLKELGLATGIELNPIITGIITGFASALAVIAVFVVGLILDLSASIFRWHEMKVFARHLDHNSEWMTAFIEAHKAYCRPDYETFRRVIREPPPRRVAKVFTWQFRIAREYERLLNFFTSYVLGQCGPAQLTLMADQYSLWRTARAIAVALWLLSIEAVTLSNLGLLASLVIIAPITWAILGLCLLIIRGPYSRLCFTLFSLLYTVCEKQIVPQKNAEPPAP